MNESAGLRAAAAPQPAIRTAATHPMLTLLKREVWEHPALWIAPLAVAAVLLVGAIFFRAYVHLPSTIPISIGDFAAGPHRARARAARRRAHTVDRRPVRRKDAQPGCGARAGCGLIGRSAGLGAGRHRAFSMNESAELRAAAAPQPAIRTAATHPMLTLLKREVWEHPALWIAPLAVAAVLLVGAIFFRAYVHLPSTIPISIGDFAAGPEQAQKVATAGLVVGYAWTQYFVMGVVLWFYATACLYNERRDRSILFWKSMPVSDAKTVLSKTLMLFAVVPLYVYLVTLLTTLVASAILAIPRFSGPSPLTLWNGGAWVHAETFAFTWLVLAMLWYAPLNAYLLALSAWARRNVQLWALSPIVAAIVERVAFGTHYLWTWMVYRLLPAWRSPELGFGGIFTPGSGVFAPGQPLAGIEPLRGFENIDLWIGLAVAAALLYIAVRIRGHRDDT